MQQLIGVGAVPILAGVVISILFLHFFRVWSRLRHVSGPFWSQFTNIPRVLWVTTGHSHEIHYAIHEKYGEVVRFGPNMVSLGNPAWIPQLYPIRPGFPKVSIFRDTFHALYLVL